MGRVATAHKEVTTIVTVTEYLKTTAFTISLAAETNGILFFNLFFFNS